MFNTNFGLPFLGYGYNGINVTREATPRKRADKQKKKMRKIRETSRRKNR